MQNRRSLSTDKSDRRENMAGSSVSFVAGAILTVQEVAAILKVPISWIYDHVRPGCRDPLPFFKMGKYLRFSAADLRDYLDERRRLQGD
jgi:excisionase family DNA binding protein